MSVNLYRLARDIRGIGSLTADRIAEKLCIEMTALVRVRAGTSYPLVCRSAPGSRRKKITSINWLAR